MSYVSSVDNLCVVACKCVNAEFCYQLFRLFFITFCFILLPPDDHFVWMKWKYCLILVHSRSHNEIITVFSIKVMENLLHLLFIHISQSFTISRKFLWLQFSAIRRISLIIFQCTILSCLSLVYPCMQKTLQMSAQEAA